MATYAEVIARGARQQICPAEYSPPPSPFLQSSFGEGEIPLFIWGLVRPTLMMMASDPPGAQSAEQLQAAEDPISCRDLFWQSLA
jgi:hypothetical protein